MIIAVQVMSTAQKHRLTTTLVRISERYNTCPMLSWTQILTQTMQILMTISLTKGEKPREKNIKDYESIVQTLRTVTSEFVTIRRPVTSAVTTPAAQMVPLNNAPYT